MVTECELLKDVVMETNCECDAFAFFKIFVIYLFDVFCHSPFKLNKAYSSLSYD